MNIRRIFPVVVFLGLAAMAVRPTIDPDMWWHLRTGELIVERGIPVVDAFSFTYPTNEWVTHEWLTQVIMWVTYRIGGFGALMILFSAVVTLTFWIVYRTSHGRPYIAGFVTLLAAGATAIVWGARPQLFNLLLAAYVVNLLERRRHGITTSRTWPVLVALMILWVNLHAGYLLGLVVMATYLVGALLDLPRGPLEGGTLRRADLGWLTLTIAGGFAVTGLNPNGYRMLTYPFETIASDVQREFITEWFPPAPDQPVFWLFGVLVALGVLVLVRNRRRVSAIDALLFAGTAVGGALSVRNIAIFAVIAAPVIARHLTALVGRRVPTTDLRTGRLDGLSGAAVAVVALAAVAVAWVTIDTNDEVIAAEFPADEVAHLAAEAPDARVLNAYGWGGYLIWNGFDVFIDGRADVYGDAGLLEFAEAYYHRSGWQDVLDDRAVDFVLVEPESAIGVVLTTTPGWDEVSRTSQAVLFARSG